MNTLDLDNECPYYEKDINIQDNFGNCDTCARYQSKTCPFTQGDME